MSGEDPRALSDEDRDRMLIDAMAKLEEAAVLVETATRMTGIRIAADTASSIRRISSGTEDAGSVANLRKAIFYVDRDPGWTHPLDSVKKQP